MAYDLETADRLRECLATESGVSEKTMFGGLAFLVDGRMAVAVSGSGGLLLRCPPADTDSLAAQEHVGRSVMGGRELAGWLHLEPAAYDDDDALAGWVARGVGVVRSLPPK